MHSYHGKTANFHFNGDFSGDVIINAKKHAPDGEVSVSAEDLLELVGRAMHDKLLAKLEQMGGKEFLEWLNDR